MRAHERSIVDPVLEAKSALEDPDLLAISISVDHAHEVQMDGLRLGDHTGRPIVCSSSFAVGDR